MTFAYTFEWDPHKAQANRRKHEVTFEQATTIFRDPLMVSIPDSEHSKHEDRWATIGLGEDGKLLVVIHTYHEVSQEEAVIRIISTRPATRHERQQYEVHA